MNIVITGASKGIGRAIAEKFAAQGYSLLLCARDEKSLALFSEELTASHPGITVHHRACDVSVKGELKSFADWVLSLVGTPEILVNNAGIFEPGSVYNEPEGLLEKLMAVNVYSAYYLTRHLLPSMMKEQQGHIFNMCSIASLQAYENGGSYSITKYALAGMSANLRHELKSYGIKVTSVYPGAVYTNSWSGSGISPERIMSANDIAELVYTCSQLSPQACVEEIVIRPQLGDL